MSRALQLGVVLVLLFMTMQSELRPPVRREALDQQQPDASRLAAASSTAMPHSKFAVAVAARAQKLDRLEARAKHCEAVKQELLAGLAEETIQLRAEVSALQSQLTSCGILGFSPVLAPEGIQATNTSVNATTTTLTTIMTAGMSTTTTDAQQAAKQQGRVHELFEDGVQSKEFDD